MTNITGHVVYMCDCCGPRVKFRTQRGAAGHEKYHSSRMSLAEMGIYPGLGEELSDYLPGFMS